MSPEKTHPDGWYRLQRRIPGVGRIRVKSGRTLPMHNRVNALVTKLVEQGKLEDLRKLKARKITAMMLVDADRRGMSVQDPSVQKLAAPLWATAEALFDDQDATEARYQRSIRALHRVGMLDLAATVGDLAGVDWQNLESDWPYSAADWNHVQRAISRLLTKHMGQHHPFRVDLMKVIPKRVELERLVELAPTEFKAILKPMPAELRHCYWTLAATGLRTLAEYQKLKDENLGNYAVRVVDSKNPTGYRNIPVDPSLWPHVRAAVPCPFKADYLTRHWRYYADLAGRTDLVLRDLRHCYGFWSVQAGIEINVIREAMGHRSLATTQKYLKQVAKRHHAAALATHLGTQAPKAVKRA